MEIGVRGIGDSGTIVESTPSEWMEHSSRGVFTSRLLPSFGLPTLQKVWSPVLEISVGTI